MPKLVYVLAAIVMGAALTIQPGLNAEVARRLANPFAATLVSIFISFAAALAFVLVTRQSADWSAALTMPRYLWLAGTIGFVFVLGALYLAPLLGAALFFAAIVAGQMIMATIVDATGFSGYASQGLDPWRLAGIALVLAGVLVFQRAA